MTVQIVERISIDGGLQDLLTEPGIPRHARIRELAPGELNPADGITRSSACWRGYIGRWRLDNGRLYLVGLRGGFRLEGAGPLFAYWFTGTLRVGIGQVVEHGEVGFDSVYERHLEVDIHGGHERARRLVRDQPWHRGWLEGVG